MEAEEKHTGERVDREEVRTSAHSHLPIVGLLVRGGDKHLAAGVLFEMAA